MGSEEPTVEIPSSVLNGLLSRLEANAREAGEKTAFMQCMQEDQRVSQGKLDQLEERLSQLEEEAATVDYSDQFREILESIQDDVEEWDELQGQEIELIQEEIKKLAGKHNSLVDNTADSVQELYERVADLEEAVADVVDDSGSDSEGKFTCSDCGKNFESAVMTRETHHDCETREADEEVSQEVDLDKSQRPNEVDKESEEDVEEEDSSEEENRDCDGVTCPQCGDEFESIDSLPTHTASLEDHVSISEFFKTDAGVYQCSLCERFETREYQSFVNHVAGHGLTLTELYLADYEELAEDTRVDENGFNANGNIPELHKTKKIEEYSQSKLIEIVEDFLDSEERAYRLDSIAEDRFEQEVDTQDSEAQKLRNAIHESDRIESRSDPYDGRRNAYYTGDSKQVVAPE